MQDLPVNNDQPEHREDIIPVMPQLNSQKQGAVVNEASFIESNVPEYILPPQKYKLKVLLPFSDFLAILVCIHILLIMGMVTGVSGGNVLVFF